MTNKNFLNTIDLNLVNIINTSSKTKIMNRPNPCYSYKRKLE